MQKFDPYAPPQTPEPMRGVDRRGAWIYALIGTPIVYAVMAFVVVEICVEVLKLDFFLSLIVFLSTVAVSWVWRGHLDKQCGPHGVGSALIWIVALEAVVAVFFTAFVLVVLYYLPFDILLPPPDPDPAEAAAFDRLTMLGTRLYFLAGLVGLIRFRRRKSVPSVS